MQGDTAMPKTMTVLIHGTLSGGNEWYRPTSDLWKHLRAGFDQDYFEDDPNEIFDWIPALPTNGARRRGGRKLRDYCDAYHASEGIESFRLIGHSHGAGPHDGTLHVPRPSCQ